MAIKRGSSGRRTRRPKAKPPTAANEASEAGRYFQRAILRALDVLECFSDVKPSLSMRDISLMMNLSESSVFRIVLTLEGRGYLMRSADGNFSLPPKLLFGRAHENGETARQIVRPILEELANRFDETASFAYLFGNRVEAMDAVESFHDVRLANRPGRTLPPHCSALGKAITAFQEKSRMERIVECYGLLARTENTITDRTRLFAEYADIRLRGYAIDREEAAQGSICIGAPLRGQRYNCPVLAAISVSTPAMRMTAERETAIIDAVIEAARRGGELLYASSPNMVALQTITSPGL